MLNCLCAKTTEVENGKVQPILTYLSSTCLLHGISFLTNFSLKCRVLSQVNIVDFDRRIIFNLLGYAYTHYNTLELHAYSPTFGVSRLSMCKRFPFPFYLPAFPFQKLESTFTSIPSTIHTVDWEHAKIINQ